ncbi:MAG: T9SS type A sorting domain-containing protein [Bacteroidetes bacterium]|nr:T9SS type A sorting domain-containing protein [Bacteroidota bacterium]
MKKFITLISLFLVIVMKSQSTYTYVVYAPDTMCLHAERSIFKIETNYAHKVRWTINRSGSYTTILSREFDLGAEINVNPWTPKTLTYTITLFRDTLVGGTISEIKEEEEITGSVVSIASSVYETPGGMYRPTVYLYPVISLACGESNYDAVSPFTATKRFQYELFNIDTKELKIIKSGDSLVGGTYSLIAQDSSHVSCRIISYQTHDVKCVDVASIKELTNNDIELYYHNNQVITNIKEEHQIKIYDITGKVVNQNNLSNGIYTIILKTNDKYYSKKFLKHDF